MAKANFKGYRATYDYQGVKYVIQRGASGYAKFYVLSESGKYLSKGAGTLQGAMGDMVRIHNDSRA